MIVHSIAITLILVAILMVAKPFVMRRVERKNLEASKQAALEGTPLPAEGTSRWERRYRPLATALVGAVVGLLVGLTSVGSGTLIIVARAFLFPRLPSKKLVGTDISHAVLLHIAAASVYFSAGTIKWSIVGLLPLGSLPGVLMGSRLSKYIPDRIMRPILATVLVLSGWKLF